MPGDLIGSEIVHHQAIVALERWNQALLDMGEEDLSGHGPSTTMRAS